MITLENLCFVHHQNRSMLRNKYERMTADDHAELFLNLLASKENGNLMC